MVAATPALPHTAATACTQRAAQHKARRTSGECLAMSFNADAVMRFSEISGSWMHSTRSGTAPASTTDCANSGERKDHSKHA